MKALLIALTVLFGSESAFAGMSEISFDAAAFRDFVCITDAGTEIDLQTATVVAENAEQTSVKFLGVISQGNNAKAPWLKQSVNVELQVTAANRGLPIAFETKIALTNPYLDKVEDLFQTTLSYVEFHILSDRTHEPGSSGFADSEKWYGFGVQCFISRR